MSTSLNILFNLVDVLAKEDTTAAIDDKQSFIDPQDLALEGVYPIKAATLETDYWKLDGTFDVFPDNPEADAWGVWSNSMSNEDGTFTIPPVLTLTFQSNHSAIGIGFEFNPHDNSYCNNLNVKYYNGETLLSDVNLYPDNWRYSFSNKVENYNKMVVTFSSMNKAGRYLKLQNVIHGIIKTFETKMITEASLLEEVDITSSELTINTFDFNVYSEDDDFNIFNPGGVYNVLQKKQQINLEGSINGVSKGFGTFYLDEWESKGNKIMSLSTVDGIGIMDGTYFYGDIYKNISAKDLIEKIMNAAGFGYSIDDSLQDILLSGWIPRCSYREALQQVAIAIGGFVDTSRSGAIKIKSQPDIDSVYTELGRDRKHVGATAKLRAYVTGVNVTEHNYVLGSSLVSLYTALLGVGTNEILFSSPVSVSTVTGAALSQKGANYCIVEVTTAGTVTVKGYKYEDNTKVISCKMDSLPAGEKENVKEIKDATLISSANSADVAKRMFDYYQMRIEQNITFVIDNEVVGGVVNVETSEGEHRKSIVEKLQTNLSGGFVTKAVVIGE